MNVMNFFDGWPPTPRVGTGRLLCWAWLITPGSQLVLLLCPLSGSLGSLCLLQTHQADLQL